MSFQEIATATHFRMVSKEEVGGPSFRWKVGKGNSTEGRRLDERDIQRTYMRRKSNGNERKIVFVFGD